MASPHPQPQKSLTAWGRSLCPGRGWCSVPGRPPARSQGLVVLLPSLPLPCVEGGTCLQERHLGGWRVISEARGLLRGRGWQVKDREVLPEYTAESRSGMDDLCRVRTTVLRAKDRTFTGQFNLFS